MSKLRKTILIIGILIVAVAASLGTALALYATGSMKTDPIELVYLLREPEAKEYDGTPLKLDDPLNDITLKSGTLSAGHHAEIEFIGSQTDVGRTLSDARIQIYDENRFNVTSEYSIKVEGSWLEVTPKTISVELPAQTVTYNGSKVLFNNYKISASSEGELVAGHKIYGSTDAALLNVGDTLPDDLEARIFDVTGRDVTANYNIVEFKHDEIEIVARKITVRPVSFEKVYDGREMFADEIEFVEGSLVEGQICEFEINEGYGDNIKDVDEIETQITSLKIYDTVGGEKVDVTENYEFNLLEYSGYLKVTPRPLTVTAKSATFVYNGEEQSLMDDTDPLSVEGLVEGEEVFSVSYLGALTDVGETDNVITEVTLKGQTQNYDITIIDGTIEITPFETVFRTFSAEKYYDGDELSDGHSEYTLANDNHSIVAGELPSLTNAGSKPNAYEVAIVDDNGDCTHNYKITYEYGTLTVKVLPVQVTLVNGESNREKVYYDSTAHTPDLANADYFSVEPLLPDGEEVAKFGLGAADFEVVAETRAMCVAGEYYYTVKFKDGTLEERRKYSNYELYVPESGVLEVAPLPLNVTLKEYTEAAAFIYSGKAVKLTVTDAIKAISLPVGITLPDDVQLANLIAKQDFTVVADEMIDAGTSYTYTVKIADSLYAKNFAVTIDGMEDGDEGISVVVKPMPVTVTLKDVERTYNGEKQSVEVGETVVSVKRTEPTAEGVDVNDLAGLAKSDLTVKFTGTDEPVNAKNHAFGVEGITKRTQNNYVFTIKSADDALREYAVLKINKFVLEVTTDTPELVYNGENQFSGLFTYGERANARHSVKMLTLERNLPVVRDVCNADGSKLTIVNKFDVAVFDGTTNVTDNYELNYVYGTLSVEPLPVTVTTGSTNRVYNGAALRNNELTADIKLCLNHRLTAVAALPEITDVDKIKNEYEIDIKGDNNVSVKSNYLITYKYGDLEVTPFEITLKTGTDEQDYDGTPLSDTTVTIETLLSGAMRTYEARLAAGAKEYSITNAGSAENIFDCAIVTAGGVDVTKNFTINYVYGTLTVKPVDITFTLDDFANSLNVDMEYDGKQKHFTVKEAIKSIICKGKPYSILDEKTGSGIEFTADDFEIEYSSAILDAGNYTYKVKFTDETFAGNFIVANPEKQMTRTVRVKKKPVIIILSNADLDDLTYSNEEKVIKAENVVFDILDEKKVSVDTDVISVKDLAVEFSEPLLNAGTYIYKVKIKDDVFAKNFLYAQPEGEITVKPFNVNVTLKNFTEIYSGDEFVFPQSAASVLPAQLNATENVADVISPADFAFAAEGGARILNAGTYAYEGYLTDEIKAGNFHLTFTGGNVVEIEPLGVNVSLSTEPLVFNGREQKLELDFHGAALITADDFEITVKQNGAPATLLKAGRYEYEAELLNGNFELLDYADGVARGTVNVGVLTVNVTLGDLTKEYDGKDYDLSHSKTTVIIDGKEYTLLQSPIASVDGDLFTKEDFVLAYDEVTALPNHSDAGEYSVGAQLCDKLADFAESVKIVTENGTVTITKRKVTLTTETKELTFDGTNQSAEGATLDRAVDGHYARAVATDEKAIVTVKDVTETAVSNDSAYKIYSLSDDGTENEVTQNYEITYVYGKLTVKPKEISVKLKADVTRTYSGANTDVSFNGEEVIDETGDGNLTADNFAVVIGDDVANVGEYTFTVKIKDEQTAKNYVIKDGEGTFTVTPFKMSVTVKDYQNEYTGTAQEVRYGDVTVLKNPDDITAAGLKFTYYDANQNAVEMLNVGKYTFKASVSDKSKAGNYEVTVTGGTYEITPANLTVTLRNYEKVYTGEKQKIEVSDAVTGISDTNGNEATIIGKSAFSVVYNNELRTVGNYTYTVEITDETMRKNFNVEFDGGEYVITKRQLLFTVSNVYMSQQNYEDGGYADEMVLDVTQYVTLSTMTPLATVDQLVITSAVAQREFEGSSVFYLYSLTEYTLSNEDCYEFVNLKGGDETALAIQLILY